MTYQAEVLSITTRKPVETKEKAFVSHKELPFLQLRTATGIWYVRKKKTGKKPLFMSTGQASVERAKTVARKLIEEWEGLSSGDIRATEMTIAQYAPKALQDWLDLPDEKYKPRSKENARRYVKEIIQEIGYARLCDINEVFIERWINLFRKKKDRTTFRDYNTYLSKILKHAKRNGVINHMPKFENPDPKKETGRMYTRAEMTRMIDIAEAEIDTKNQQHHLRALQLLVMLRLSFNNFCRKREALCAPWSELDLETGRWHIPKERWKNGTKTGKPKEFFVHRTKVLPLMRKLKALNKHNSPWIFPNPIDPTQCQWDNKTAWKNLKKKAGISDPARWHDLRHTALTYVLVGDDEFQAALEKMTSEQQEASKAERLMNPLLVAKYAGTNVRTIESVYLKVKAEHTQAVGQAIDL